jgi:hypothetical protein
MRVDPFSDRSFFLVNYRPSLVLKIYSWCYSRIQALGECLNNFFSQIVHFKRSVFLSYQISSRQWSLTNRIKLIYELYRSDDPKGVVELTNMLVANEIADFRDEVEVLKQINCIPTQDREEIVSLTAFTRKELPYFTTHDQQKIIIFLQAIPKDRRKHMTSQMIQLLQKEPCTQAEKPALYELLFSEWTFERRCQLAALLPPLCAVSSSDVAVGIAKMNFASSYPSLTLSLTRLLPSTNLTEENYEECFSLLHGYCLHTLPSVAQEYWKAPLSLAPSLFDLECFLQDFMKTFPVDEPHDFMQTLIQMAELHREDEEAMKKAFPYVLPFFELLPIRSSEEARIQLISLMKFLKDPICLWQLALNLKRERQPNEKQEIYSLEKIFRSKFQDKILNDISTLNIHGLERSPEDKEKIVKIIFRDQHLNKLPILIIHLLEVPREYREAVMELISSLSDSKDSLEMLHIILYVSDYLDFQTIIVLGQIIVSTRNFDLLSDFDSSIDFVSKQGRASRVRPILFYFKKVRIAYPLFSSCNILRVLLEEISDETEILDLLNPAVYIMDRCWAKDRDWSFLFGELIQGLKKLSIEERVVRSEEICKSLQPSEISPYISLYLLSNKPPLSDEVYQGFYLAGLLCRFWESKYLIYGSSAFMQLFKVILEIPERKRSSTVAQTVSLYVRSMVLYEEFPFYTNKFLLTPENTVRLLTHFSEFSLGEFTWQIDTLMVDGEPQKILLQLGKLIWIYKKLPQLNYIGSLAFNAGGVTRDMMARLFKALRQADRVHLPFRESVQEKDTLILPQLKNPALLNKEELGLLVAIGKVFGSALCNRNHIVVGGHFHPLLFKLLHTLSPNDFWQMSSFDELIYHPIDALSLDSSNFIPKKIYNKLLKVYLLEEYPFIFGENLEQRQINIDLFIEKDALFESMKEEGISNKEDFLNIYKIPHTLFAVSCIAKTCYDLAPYLWRELQNSSYLVLAHRIQGSLFKEEILNSCKWTGRVGFREENELYLASWLIDATEDDVALFVQAFSGGSAMPEGKKLEINLYIPEDLNTLPTFSTCSFIMNLPARYPNYETFRNKLNLAISSAKDPGGGFGFI